ncbi:S1C family serine protease [Limnochorda pilosa]|uniref:Peptidase S1 n=1 Tax=Limnochorda pilosa TaxID=1555112 RepID=A0A0K2SQG5_LIMPI|nr:trypsin-like peptidase domain-containing protein [Limnochorda pilosa]BAS29341.1 peptidase S1 [Limnochorda pilosa]
MRRGRRTLLYLGGALALVLAGVLLASLLGTPSPIRAQDPPADTQQAPPAEESPAAALAFPGGSPSAVADVAERLNPATVYIEVTLPQQPRQQQPFNDPFFGPFFGPFFPPDQGRPMQAGTGFIIDQEGHVLTNQHVVGNLGGKQSIRVYLETADFKGWVDANLIGADYQLDLAVLQIQKPRQLKELPVAPLGNSDAMRPGDWVLAIGNPFGEQLGLAHTVTVGVVSAQGRQISVWDQSRRTPRTYTDLMQTDAAINEGNSGGPLINLQGEVVGINTAVNTQAQGIGFAIPINTAKKVLQDLIERGMTPGGPWIGVSFTDVTAEIAGALGLSSTDGIVVSEVIAGQPAEKAGLQAYDVIVELNRKAVKNGEEFQKAVQQLKPGDTAVVRVIRGGRSLLLTVEVGERPPEFR